MKIGINKGPYVASGLLVSLLFSFLVEIVSMFKGNTNLFTRSISGLQYDFLLFPVFIAFGVLGGYLFWLLSNRKK